MRPVIIDRVLLRLALATAKQHSAAQEHLLHRDLVAGLLPRSIYVTWLEQLFFVHRILEWHLGRLRSMVSPLEAVVRDHHFHTPALASDLACFDVDLGSLTPLPATTVLVELIDGIAVRAPLALLGFAYVLEQGKNGGRQIAKRARLAYRLAAGEGVAYLDPYGEAQAERWLEFMVNMAATRFEPAEIDVIADAACRMFESLTAIMTEVLAADASAQRAPAV